MSYPTRPAPKILVGLDFGTTFSGFAYAHKSAKEESHVFYDWPATQGKPYCKTQTALYYKRSTPDGALQLNAWGWQAQKNYTRDLDFVQRKKAHQSTVGEFITRFKLHLADRTGSSPKLSTEPLPGGLTTKQVITDFLREIGRFIMEQLKRDYGGHVSMDEVQWCVTVPSIWGEGAKQKMKSFMGGAGLVGGNKGSPHPVMIVLEPEAAAVHCVKKVKSFKLNQGDRFLVADIGGGTSDIVVQEKANSSINLKVKEVTASSGGLCGGSFVDQAFMEFMAAKIGCLNKVLVEYPMVKLHLQKWWENAKTSFDGRDTDEVFTCPLPRKLTDAWEKHDPSHDEGYWDSVALTHADMVHIFSRVVKDNIALIKEQLQKASNVKLIMVVGGFASSRYLMSKIQQAFEPGIPVVSPTDPGRAICDGAVSIGFFPDNILARVARRTLGVNLSVPFRKGDPESTSKTYENGVKYCTKVFEVFVRAGSAVDMDFSVEKSLSPIFENQPKITVEVYSSQSPSPRYTTDPGATLEGKFDVDISSSLHMTMENRKIRVTMFFGHSSIEVKAQPEHLVGTLKGAEILPVTIDWA